MANPIEHTMSTEQGFAYWTDNNIELGQLHRYLHASGLASGKDVLDMACGEGHGSALLADVARHVLGIDASADAIRQARARHAQDRLEFSVSDGTYIPLPNASVDMVVVFFTGSRQWQPRLLSEIKRVLRPSGVLLASVPVGHAHAGGQIPTDDSLRSLATVFGNLQIFQQAVVLGSDILAESPNPAPVSRYAREADKIDALQDGIRPGHWIVLASDAELPEAASSHLEEPFEEAEVVQAWQRAITSRDRHIAALAQTLAERDSQNRSLSETAESLAAKLEKTETTLKEIVRSTSWRVSYPLRAAKRLLGLAPRLPASPDSFVWKALRKITRHAPFSEPIRQYLQPIVFKKYPAKFGHLPSFKQWQNEQRLAQIKLPTTDRPLVSVIVPVYGQVGHTLMCLLSISLNPPKTPFEIIVINDCSPDDSLDYLNQVQGITLINNTSNQGFIRSCNLGSKQAVGEYLCFLNNDTEVSPGWLEELVGTFDEFPGTGLAGSKLVYPDGRLQEAGGIIWQDGSAWNFGRGQDPALPVYNYAREVDYCSGASILLPKALFDELGGFDEHYLPAYCEDSDLALKVRNLGYRVIYQPLSVVVHHEGITSGTDTTQGTKAYQVVNMRKQFDRWQHRLKTHQANGVDVDKAKDRMAKRRVLVLDHCTPTPDQDAGSILAFNTMLLLREMEYQVTFIPEHNFLYMPDYTAGLQRAGIEALYAPHCLSVEKHLIEQGKRYDLVLLFRPAVVEAHLPRVRIYCPQAKTLFHTQDLHFLRMEREAALFQDEEKRFAAHAMKQSELAAMRSVDASIVVSTAERDLLRRDLPHEKIHVFPLIMEIPGTRVGFNARQDIVFVGGYQHPPNIDAVLFFANDIMPLLRRRLPGVKFYAVGSKATPEIHALACDDIIITGFVEELNPLLDKMRVSVAPLRYGAGIKGKIGTAMAAGLPTVATALAAEGMSLVPGEHIMVADGAAAFVDAIAQLYEDEALWRKLSEAGQAFAEQAWGAEAAYRNLAEILCGLGLDSQRGAHPLKLYSPNAPASHPSATPLQPVFTAYCREDYEQGLQREEFAALKKIQRKLMAHANAEVLTAAGFCVPCNKMVSMRIDMTSGGQRIGDALVPNWRERLVCPFCQMNNRQRLVATLVKQQLKGCRNLKAYFMEQVTPIYHWAMKTFPQHQIIGSEYFSHEHKKGEIINGIRHEDVMDLSFDDNSLDLIVSNDVFEHVPNPRRAFAECARVLRPGGVMLATLPFHSTCDVSVARAELTADGLKHLLPPVFHGNPISPEGSLVFTDFGWDVLPHLKGAGFSEAHADVYASSIHGHLGDDGQLVFFFARKGQ